MPQQPETPKSFRFAGAGSQKVRVLAILVMAICGLGFAGCQERLLTPDEPRSQYDRYDAVRDQRAASTYTDEYGFKRPNLRGRLLPKD